MRNKHFGIWCYSKINFKVESDYQFVDYFPITLEHKLVSMSVLYCRLPRLTPPKFNTGVLMILWCLSTNTISTSCIVNDYWHTPTSRCSLCECVSHLTTVHVCIWSIADGAAAQGSSIEVSRSNVGKFGWALHSCSALCQVTGIFWAPGLWGQWQVPGKPWGGGRHCQPGSSALRGDGRRAFRRRWRRRVSLWRWRCW